MSYESFWHNTQLQRMAGPIPAVIHLPRYPKQPDASIALSQSTLEIRDPHFLHKSEDGFPDPRNNIRPNCRFPLSSSESTIDDDDAADVAKYCDLHHIASEEVPGQGLGDRRIRDAGRMADAHLTLSSSCLQPVASSELAPRLFPTSTGEINESQWTVTPKLNEPEDSDTDTASSSRTQLSPYAPMPLPPIFSLETDAKDMRVSIDNTSSALVSPFWLSRDDVAIPIDPALDSHVPVTRPAPTHEQFARGSTTSACLWPPASQPVPLYHSICPEAVELSVNVSHIPLDTAMRLAEDLRARNIDPYLPLEFLMTFMGQPARQSLWHCYIQGCGKQLARKGHMYDHIRMHLNDKMFGCEHCSQTFLRKADCKRHAATHNPVKAFNCSSCMKSYGRKDLLTRHIRVCQPDKEGEYQYLEQVVKSEGRKRKEMQGSSLQNIQCTPGFVNPSMLLMPGFKSAENSWTYLHDDGNKENIDPSLLAIGHVFNQSPAADTYYGTGGERRKRARTRF